MERLVYLYGIVPADSTDPPPDLGGIDGAPVTLVRAGSLAAITSEVAAAEYSDESVNGRLSDLAWVGERGLAHERVLDWFAERGPVIPLSLFSLHNDQARVRDRLAQEADRFQRTLAQLRGRREWGVKLWRVDARLTEHLAELSPAIAALARESDEAPPGKRFLLTKKRETLQAEEMRRLSARVSHEVYGRLREHSERSTTVPLPGGLPATGRTLLLHAAFLVPDPGFDAFQRQLSELAGTFQPIGFEFEFTGPWPPYHFAEPDGG